MRLKVTSVKNGGSYNPTTNTLVIPLNDVLAPQIFAHELAHCRLRHHIWFARLSPRYGFQCEVDAWEYSRLQGWAFSSREAIRCTKAYATYYRVPCHYPEVWDMLLEQEESPPPKKKRKRNSKRSNRKNIALLEASVAKRAKKEAKSE